MRIYHNKKLVIAALAVFVAAVVLAARVFAAANGQYEFLPGSSYTLNSTKATIKIYPGSGPIPRRVTWRGPNGASIISSWYVDQELYTNGAVVWRTFDFYIKGYNRTAGTYTAVVETYDMVDRLYVEMFRANFSISGGGPVDTPTPVPTLNPTPIGRLDPDFGSQGFVTADFYQGYDNAVGVVLQADGKIVVVGTFSGTTGGGQIGLVRYTRDGSLDASFGTGGKVLTNPFGSNDQPQPHAIALQEDGKIVVAGYLYYAGDTNTPVMLMLRYNPDGSLDTGFGVGGKVVNAGSMGARAIALQEDGKIVAASFDGLWRFNRNGSLDTTFGSGGEAVASVNGAGVAIQKDGKIIVSTNKALWRVNSDGSPDITFGPGGEVNCFEYPGSLALQQDGMIMVADDIYPKMARYRSDGSLDPSFGTGGIAYLRISKGTILLLDDGKFVVAGYWNKKMTAARYNSDGSPDNANGANSGMATLPGDMGNFDSLYDYAAAQQTDGKIIIAGTSLTGYESTFTDWALVRFILNSIHLVYTPLVVK
jgi:uncharacterized delta-60 repeat protein